MRRAETHKPGNGDEEGQEPSKCEMRKHSGCGSLGEASVRFGGEGWTSRGAWQVRFGMGGRFGKCSLMFAYVRLCSLNRKKIVEGATRCHYPPQEKEALRAAIADCKMHEMMNRRRRCGSAVEPS